FFMVTSFFAFADTKGTLPAGQNFPHIKTFGFDYIRFQDNNGAFLDNLRWLANRHDWIVGAKGNWPAQGVDYLDTLTYNTIKTENPNTKIMSYLPYHSIAPNTMVWLEDWAGNNGYNPEDLYYHYGIDTTIRITGSERESTTGGSPSVGVVNIQATNPAIVELVSLSAVPSGAKLKLFDIDGSTHPVDNVIYTVLPINGSPDQYYLYTNDMTPVAVDGTSWPAFTGDWAYTTVDSWDINTRTSVGVVNIQPTNPAIVEFIIPFPYDTLPAGVPLRITDLDGSSHPVDDIVYTVQPVAGQPAQYYLYTNDNIPIPVDGTNWPILTGDWKFNTVAYYGKLSIPGFPNGWAPTRYDSRLRVRWNHGWVGINPSSPTFRAAFKALALHVITLEGTTDTFAEGLFLDTFDGLVNQSINGWASFLENTTELQSLGSTTAVYDQVTADMANSADELKTFLIQNTGNSDFRLQVNPAVPRYVYNTFSELFNEQYRDILMDLSIEYLVTTTVRLTDLPYLQLIYDDMDNGRLFFIRSQTNFAPPRIIPYGFNQFALSNHYLINHENANFMYHYGAAGNYGGFPYGNPTQTHWHINMEVNIGQPVARAGEDYWGITNTDRFFTFAQDTGYEIVAREYNDALVLAKYAQVGGWNNIGNNPTTHPLGGTYYILLEDNTVSAAVTEITLGTSEGAILMKNNNTLPTDILAPITTASVQSGTYNSTQNISLSRNEAAITYYTIDGATPTTLSDIYFLPIAISSNT
ncbi:hypothetical protein MNBD_GAMMA01-284, partial [hydrothermal vent metagenome]